MVLPGLRLKCRAEKQKKTAASLSGVKRTCLFALHMSAYDPKRTWSASFRCDAHYLSPSLGRSSMLWEGHLSAWIGYLPSLVELAQVSHRRPFISVRWVMLCLGWSEARCSAG